MTSQEYLNSHKALSSKNEWALFDVVTLTVRGRRLSVVAVVEVRLHFNCPKMSDRLLYQSEAEHLVLERGLVAGLTRGPFFTFF